MRRLSLFWKLYVSYVLVILLVALAWSYVMRACTTEGPAHPSGSVPTQTQCSVPSLILGGGVLLWVAAALGWFLSRRISQPLEDMRQGAERFAAGDFAQALSIPELPELGGLARTLNRMAAQLASQIGVITQQRNEQEAILASMHEGVLALDTRERVLTVNRAAEALLGVVGTQAKGHTIQEVIRNVALQRLLVAAMHSPEPATADIVLHSAEERFLQATATALRDAFGRDIGVLVVLNDVTQLRRLENIRRDFVSNVSHELKTPITSIQGFIETLRDGALHDSAHAERFLGIIARHAERLHAIIEDLLALSRLEQGSEHYDIPRTEACLSDLLHAAILDCAAKAEARRIKMTSTCDATLRATVNAPLLEQAIANLLDNALTYSQPEREVWVQAAQDHDTLVITVRDQGNGIPPEHLDRIFERFYRVDKARSRERGGTGLGLAIVKHIAQVHGGSVAVASTVGQGSTFTLRLPVHNR
ncbi:MAG: HAMP domain-containing protein [Candidatus Tectomicrobia bacterium]|uniref:histidine kinase n=1 Tax=Tectimicrobiota bacterium TaxID=2528274 RepID=A0A938B094_UNCTE|nr:HAMP domain-containing protein [Candidatus Tectomicrobia bacterium]